MRHACPYADDVVRYIDVWHVPRPHELGVEDAICYPGIAFGRPALPYMVCPRVTSLAVLKGEGGRGIEDPCVLPCER